MDIDDNVELTPEDLPTICRLCLQHDDFTINIFDRIDPNPKKRPLPERIQELYQLKVSPNDGLPINICHRCLFYTENFSEFREKIRLCETRLLDFMETYRQSGQQKTDKLPDRIEERSTAPFDPFQTHYSEAIEIDPNDDNIVMIIDPNKDYDSTESESEAEQETTTVPLNNNNNSSINNNTSKKSTISDFLTNDLLSNIFYCQHCDAAFTDPVHCTAHEGTHDPNYPYQCTMCSYRSADRTVYVAHVKISHGINKPYTCITCNRQFGRRSDLKKHSIVHTGIRPYVCRICGKNFSRNTNLSKHMRTHSGDRPHICEHDQCRKAFMTKGDLYRHSQMHLGDKPFKCDKCPSSFSRKNKLNHHARSHVNELPRLSQEPSILRSNECMEMNSDRMVVPFDPFTPLKPELASHSFTGQTVNNSDYPQKSSMDLSIQPMEMRNVPQPIPQTLLEAQLMQPQLMPMSLMLQRQPNPQPQTVKSYPANHTNQSNNLPPPPPIYPNYLPEPLQMDRPFYQSHPINNYYPQLRPPLLPALLAQPPSQPIYPNRSGPSTTFPVPQPIQPPLQSGKTTKVNQIKSKPYPCDQCSKRFSMLSALEKHKMAHNGIYSWTCNVCGKTFTRKREFDRHSRNHTSVRPYPCTRCTKTFARRDKLMRHEQMHDFAVSCNQCSQRFSDNTELTIHINTAHSIDRQLSPIDIRQPVGTMMQQQTAAVDLSVTHSYNYSMYGDQPRSSVADVIQDFKIDVNDSGYLNNVANTGGSNG